MAVAEELQVVIRAEVDKALRDLRSFDRQLDGTSGKARQFGESLGRVGRTMSTAFTVPIVAAGTAAVKFAADIERQQTAFGVLLQDVERGNQLFEELKTFSAQTPLQLDDITKASQTLLAFGTNAENVQDQIRMIGDVAQGQAEKLDRIALAFGKIQARGKASMEEINVLIEAGVPIIAELAENLGVAESEIFAMVTAGKIGFTEIEGALQSMTGAGGQFEGMMEKIAQTTAGKFSTAVDNLKLAAAELGAELLPMVNELLDRVTEAAKWFGELDDGTKRLIINMGALAAASGPIMMAVGALMKMKATIIAINTTALFGPVGLIAGLAALGVGLVTIGRNRREAQLEEIANEFADVEAAAGLATEEIEAISEALRMGSMDGFTDANEQVAALAENLGVSKLAVIDIGINSEYVTQQYKEQLQALRDQYVEQISLNALMEDSWMAHERERAAADARAQAILEQRAADVRAAAEAQAAIQERANEAYENIERRLKEIGRIEEFNLEIGEEYNALEESRKAILDEVNDLLIDGVALNTSYSGALEYILQLYGEILKATEEINDNTPGGGGSSDDQSKKDWEEYYTARIEGEKIAAAEVERLRDKQLEAERERTEEYKREFAERHNERLRLQREAIEEMTRTEEQFAAHLNKLEIRLEPQIVEGVGGALDGFDWWSVGTDIAQAFEEILKAESPEQMEAAYNDVFDNLARTLGNFFVDGLGDLLVSIGRLMRTIFRRREEEDEWPSAMDRRRKAVEELNELLSEELRIRNDAMRELDRAFGTEFDVLRDQWQRNLIDTDQFMREMEGLNEEYAAEEDDISAEVTRIRELIEKNEAGAEWMKPGYNPFGQATSAATGANFMTRGPQLLMVGDNASGREHVQVTPDGYGGSGVTVNVYGDNYGIDSLGERVHAALEQARSRGRIPA